jgi:hypothetical protein
MSMNDSKHGAVTDKRQRARRMANFRVWEVKIRDGAKAP